MPIARRLPRFLPEPRHGPYRIGARLGCGTATIAIALAGDVTGRVVGVDASAERLQVAKGKAESLEGPRGTCDYPVAGPFELVVCCFNTIQPTGGRGSAAGVRRVGSLLAPKGFPPSPSTSLDYLHTPQTNHLPRP
jgi:hypothetical protein